MYINYPWTVCELQTNAPRWLCQREPCQVRRTPRCCDWQYFKSCFWRKDLSLLLQKKPNITHFYRCVQSITQEHWKWFEGRGEGVSHCIIMMISAQWWSLFTFRFMLSFKSHRFAAVLVNICVFLKYFKLKGHLAVKLLVEALNLSSSSSDRLSQERLRR